MLSQLPLARSLRRLVAAAAFATLLAGCKTSTSDIVSAGGNLYTVTRESTITLNRNDSHMKALAQEDAARFCEMRGKQLQVVNVSEEKPDLRDGFITVKLTFRAVDINSSPAPAATAAPADVAPAGSSQFYRQLKELEDLRQSGVITEDDFQAAKKRVLAHIQ